MTQPQGLKPGIYLNLSNEDYHADPAISSSGIKKLLKSPEAYWVDSPLNPKRQSAEETAALKLGRAYHELVLEPENFNYIIKEGCKTSTKEGTLGEGQYKELCAMRDRLFEYKQIPLMISNGLPEVSVFWQDEETGLMCRCRFDFWKAGFITDLKSVSELDKELGRDIWYDFPKYGYDVSGAMYMEGSRNLKKMLRAGTCHVDDGIPQDFLEQYLDNDKERFVFLYQSKSAPYEAQARCMTESIAEVGLHKFRAGLEKYLQYTEAYNDKPWLSLQPEIIDITIDNVSSTINYA